MLEVIVPTSNHAFLKKFANRNTELTTIAYSVITAKAVARRRLSNKR